MLPLAMLFSSCSKTGDYKSNVPTNLGKELELQMRTDNEEIESLKADYELFTPEEKEDFWRTHTENYLAEHGGDMTSSQLDFIDTLLNTLQPEIFDTTTDEYQYFIGTKAGLLTSQALTVFSISEASMLLTYDETAGSEPPLKCNCSTQSDWCSYNNYCVLGRSNCVPVKGCGLWWSYTCNGRCWIA